MPPFRVAPDASRNHQDAAHRRMPWVAGGRNRPLRAGPKRFPGERFPPRQPYQSPAPPPIFPTRNTKGARVGLGSIITDIAGGLGQTVGLTDPVIRLGVTGLQPRQPEEVARRRVFGRELAGIVERQPRRRGYHAAGVHHHRLTQADPQVGIIGHGAQRDLQP